MKPGRRYNKSKGLFFLLLSFVFLLVSACTSMGTRANNTDFKAETGLASWYGADETKVREHGRLTASGERYDMYDMTAAHKTLPLGSLVRVTNLENGKKVVVRINDRGPYVKGRIIDLSLKAARILGLKDKGTAKVRIEPI